MVNNTTSARKNSSEGRYIVAVTALYVPSNEVLNSISITSTRRKLYQPSENLKRYVRRRANCCKFLEGSRDKNLKSESIKLTFYYQDNFKNKKSISHERSNL